MEDALIKARGNVEAAYQLLSVQASAKRGKKSGKKPKKSTPIYNAEQQRRLDFLRGEIKKIEKEAMEAKKAARPPKIVKKPAAKPAGRADDADADVVMADVSQDPPPPGILYDGGGFEEGKTTLDYMVEGVAPWAIFEGDKQVRDPQPYLTRWILKFPPSGKPIDPELKETYPSVYYMTAIANSKPGVDIDSFDSVGIGTQIPSFRGNRAPQITINNVPASRWRFELVDDYDNPESVLLGRKAVPEEYRGKDKAEVIVKKGVDVDMPDWYLNSYGDPEGVGDDGKWPTHTMVIIVPYSKSAENKYSENYY